MKLQNLFKDADNMKSYPQGTVIFETGADGDGMYVVVEGELSLLIGDEVIESIAEGGLAGEMAIIDSSKRSATAVAKTDCKLVFVDERRFLFMVQQTPFFALHVMRVLADRLRHMNSRLG